jgi:predicted DNA-binding transcriptional regulator AlpA
MAAKQAAPARSVRLIDKPEVLRRVPVSYTTIWGLMQEDKFPRSRELGGKVMWIEAEIDDWVAGLPIRQFKGEDGHRSTPNLKPRRKAAR